MTYSCKTHIDNLPFRRAVTLYIPSIKAIPLPYPLILEQGQLCYVAEARSWSSWCLFLSHTPHWIYQHVRWAVPPKSKLFWPLFPPWFMPSSHLVSHWTVAESSPASPPPQSVLPSIARGRTLKNEVDEVLPLPQTRLFFQNKAHSLPGGSRL